MKRNLKTLGLALIAVLAMSAMVASAASAATFTATAGARITATDSGDFRFTVTDQTITCGNVVFTGTAPAASFTSITMFASFNDCTGVTTAVVTGFGGGGCDFVFYASGTADLVCPAGKDVTVDMGPCVAHIPGQAGLGTLTYTNNGGHVDIAFNLTKVKANHTDGFLCPFGSSGESSGDVYETSAGGPMTAIPTVGTFGWDA